MLFFICGIMGRLLVWIVMIMCNGCCCCRVNCSLRWKGVVVGWICCRGYLLLLVKYMIRWWMVLMVL